MPTVLPLPVCTLIDVKQETWLYKCETFGVRLDANCEGLPCSQVFGRHLPGDVLICAAQEPREGQIAVIRIGDRVSAMAWEPGLAGDLQRAKPPAEVIGVKVGQERTTAKNPRASRYLRDADWKEIAGGRDLRSFWQEQDR